jgi:hypothetical protein
MKTCSYCGRENEEALVACRECGTELNLVEPAHASPVFTRRFARLASLGSMTPQTQKRFGWAIVTASVALSFMLQTAFGALWFYRHRPVSAKSSQMVAEPVFIWPVIVLLLLPVAFGIVLACIGYFRHHILAHDNAAS